MILIPYAWLVAMRDKIYSLLLVRKQFIIGKTQKYARSSKRAQSKRKLHSSTIILGYGFYLLALIVWLQEVLYYTVRPHTA